MRSGLPERFWRASLQSAGRVHGSHRTVRRRSGAVSQIWVALSDLVVASEMLGCCSGQSIKEYPTLTGRLASETDTQPLISNRALLGPSGF